jgi:hypothetical protein
VRASSRSSGSRGSAKPRLSAEFERYLDGLVGDVYWHRGRCLAYGDGVAYWALAEMVRMRAGITEQEGPEAAAAKLRAALETYLGDTDERAWVEQRVAQLLGAAQQESFARDDLFAACRLFFEILAHLPSEPRAETQERASIAIGRAAVARAEGGHEEALEFVEEACSLRGSIGPDHPNFKQAIAGGLESAVALGDVGRVEAIFEQVRGLSRVRARRSSRRSFPASTRTGPPETAMPRRRSSASSMRQRYCGKSALASGSRFCCSSIRSG